MGHLLLQNMKSIIFDRPLKQGMLIQDRFEVIDVLGMGSYGITYLTLDHERNVDCVLKQMKPSRKNEEKVHISFEYEKRILSFLNHPQIPKYGESIFYNGQHFFTMDYIRGKTFEDLIFADGVMYEELDVMRILSEVLNIVAYVHAQNIIHRDLRIPNIMVNDGAIYIVDFGLARFIEGKKGASLNDMSGYDIEKKLKRELHYRSDFYALGHFLLFLLYSSFTPQSKKEKSWEEELQITNEARLFLRRLLQIDHPYTDIKEVIQDVTTIINMNQINHCNPN